MSQQIPVGFLTTHHARRDPSRPMVTQELRTWSRGELEARANRLARALSAEGVGQDDFVAVMLPNGLEMFETSFALWKLGATPAPLSLKLPDAELQPILKLIEPRLVICDDPSRSIGYPTKACLSLVNGELSAEPVPERVPKYYRIATSGGSTGRPKIIVDRRPPFWDPSQPALHQKVDGVMLNPGPLYHSGPFSLTHTALFVGNHVVNMDKFDSLRLLELIDLHGVDWVYLVPTMMNRIWRLPEEDRLRFDLSSLQVAFHMASACPIWLKEKWIEWLGPDRIWELYSGTESIGSTVISGREWLEKKGSVGRIQSNGNLAVLSPEGEPCSPNQVGEIFFKVDQEGASSYHYIGAEPRTCGDWQSLGDLGYLDDDGYLFVVDRRTDMIVSGGANVYTAEVEAAVESHPAVETCVVVGLPDEDLVHRVHAIIQMAADSETQLSADQLRDFLRDLLVGYKIPRTFEFVDHALRDSAGKVRRAALRQERIIRMQQELGPALGDANVLGLS